MGGILVLTRMSYSGGGLRRCIDRRPGGWERSYVSVSWTLTSGIRAFVEVMHDFEHVSKVRTF